MFLEPASRSAVRSGRGLETCDARRPIAAIGVGSIARMGIETRLRATEGRVAAANGLDVKGRWVDIASPPVRVRLLESGVGDPVSFLNGISAPGIGMAPLAGRLPGRCQLLVDLRLSNPVQRRLSRAEIEQLIQHYREGASINDLAGRRYHLHRTTVIHHLDQAGITRRRVVRKMTNESVALAPPHATSRARRSQSWRASSECINGPWRESSAELDP